MMKKNSINDIITYKNFGYVKCNVSDLMKKRNISKSQIIKKTGLHHQIVDRYLNDDIIRFDKEVIAKLCYVLNCDINDIIIYVKPKD